MSKKHLRSNIGLNDAGTKMSERNGLISYADEVSCDLYVIDIDGQIGKKISAFEENFRKSAELITMFV